METDILIEAEIHSFIRGHRGPTALDDQQTADEKTVELRKSFMTFSAAFSSLRPAVPVDGIPGFIAFDGSLGSKRLKLTVGKFLTRKCKLKEILTDAEIRTLANQLTLALWKTEVTDTVEILHGDAITQAYANKVGGSSCMAGSCAIYTELYAVNPDRFGLLTIHRCNDSARAVVHGLDNGRQLLGRVYTTDSDLRVPMDKYATDRDWYLHRNACKIDQNELVMSGLVFDDMKVPYQDTLSKAFIKNNHLTIFYETTSILFPQYTLDSTEGLLSDITTCDNCSEEMVDGESTHIEDGVYCSDCLNQLYFYCGGCDEYCALDDAISIVDGDTGDMGGEEHICKSCAGEKYAYCESCDNWVVHDKATSTEDEVLCNYCFGEEYGTCDECEKSCANNDLHDFTPDCCDSEEFDSHTVFCPDCIDDEKEKSKARGDKVRGVREVRQVILNVILNTDRIESAEPVDGRIFRVRESEQDFLNFLKTPQQKPKYFIEPAIWDQEDKERTI